MGISNQMDETNNFYTPRKVLVTYQEERVLFKTWKRSGLEYNGTTTSAAGKDFKTHYHLMVLEKDTKIISGDIFIEHQLSVELCPK